MQNRSANLTPTNDWHTASFCAGNKDFFSSARNTCCPGAFEQVASWREIKDKSLSTSIPTEQPSFYNRIAFKLERRWRVTSQGVLHTAPSQTCLCDYMSPLHSSPSTKQLNRVAEMEIADIPHAWCVSSRSWQCLSLSNSPWTPDENWPVFTRSYPESQLWLLLLSQTFLCLVHSKSIFSPTWHLLSCVQTTAFCSGLSSQIPDVQDVMPRRSVEKILLLSNDRSVQTRPLSK